MIFITISERHLTQLVEKTTLISKRTENMKKTYINPEMEIVKVQTQQMLAVSNIDIDSSATPIDPSGADSREFDFPIWLLDV